MINLAQRDLATYQVLPDRFLENNNTDRMAAGLHALYRPPIRRITREDGLTWHQRDAVTWEVYLSATNVCFYVTVPRHWSQYAANQLAVAWPKATAKERDTVFTFDENMTAGAVLALGQHYYFGLQVDKRQLAPMPALLETTRMMQGKDQALVQWVFDPAGSDWVSGAQEAAKQWQAGGMPRRLEINKNRLALGAVRTVAALGMEIQAIAASFLTDTDIEPAPIPDADRAGLLRQGQLSAHTLRKIQHNAFDATCRVLVSSDSNNRREAILRGIAAAYNTISAENYLVAHKRKPDILIKQVLERRLPGYKINPDYLSSAEAGRIMQLPPFSLQEEYAMVERVANRELEIAPALLTPGLPIGTVTHRGEAVQVNRPVDNYDEMMLPLVVIGGMGTGKSQMAAGLATDAIRAGYSAFVLDVTDGDMANAVRDSLPSTMPEDHIIDLDFGNVEWPIPLNWGETTRPGARSRDVSNILANQLVEFLSKFGDDAGDRTARYVRAAGRAVFANRNATLLDVVLMLCSETYRQRVEIADPRLADIWRDFDSVSEGMRGQIVGPILNRLDKLTENDYIANCVFQRQKLGAGRIDFRKWADGDERGPYAVILRAPKSVLWDEATDSLATFLIAKVWLSILTRIDQPTGSRRPCYLVMDEPHQYLGSAKGGSDSTWARMVVEARKWRLGLVFLLHDWGQLPRDLALRLKSAGPHYCIYSSSKETFQALAEEIAPFTLEEALQMPTHYAINVITAGKKAHRFLAKMALPPVDLERKRSWRHEYIDRSERTIECSKQFGRPRDDVEADIYAREKVLWQAQSKPKAKRRR